MIVVYSRFTKAQLEKHVDEAIKGVRKFFKDNPKRRVCKAELFYGKMMSLKPETFEKQIRDEAAKTDTK